MTPFVSGTLTPRKHTRSVGVSPTRLWHGHPARASVAQTVVSVLHLDTTVQATLVGVAPTRHLRTS
ncbi:MAG: hypothetical protein NZ874_06065 [Fimbriimonadales bacterium]|nr:hypothetical protein [Fimbriimonadales bacterium]